MVASFFAIILAVSVLMGMGTALHALEHQKSVLWGLLVALTGILGLVLYSISLATD